MSERRVAVKAVAIAAFAAFVTAALGATMTDTGPWYQQLRQPPWRPPDVVFAPIWTIVFALTAAAGAFAWYKDSSVRGRQWIVGLFALNYTLNVVWSIVFFQLRRPDFALVEVVALWGSVLALIVFLKSRAPIASLLLIPYLVWVVIAAFLNFEVVRLNGPFG